MGSTGAGTGRGGGGGSRTASRTPNGTEMTVNYRGSGPSTYRQTSRGVVNVTTGKSTRTGIKDLSEVRRNARRAGNRTRITKRG